MRKAVLGVVALCFGASLTGCASTPVANAKLSDAGTATGFISMSTEYEGELRPGVVYVPRNYDPRESWPLIVFLHGIGERGRDGLRQAGVGIGPAILSHPGRFPCLVFMPQCDPGGYWTTNNSPAHIENGVKQILNRYAIDESRITLTGLSMGGFGTYIYGAQQAGRYAAFMPLCGGGNPEDADALAKRPVWAFHGADDQAVPAERSVEMVEAIREAGGDVQYTEYPDTGHNCWDKTYNDPDAIEWLLSQEKP